ncbi:MAG TPA: 4,5-DOPA dioxygenase extradiol, partial [Candidatus Baltobacteraceae bacterium]|nr:4,5-DOPA dioxygenase extradiol [Candidatus Baltobacteraceae bacterium]
RLQIPTPIAILCVSAHWYVPFTAVTAMQRPRTIHDFGGFPRELFEVNYPAPGSPALARKIQAALEPLSVSADERWGLDHGAWSILVHMFPEADTPVIQISIDERQSPLFHYDIGKRLAPLRDEGVLILGSGNIVHNLEAYAWGQHSTEPYPWAVRFESRARELLRLGEHRSLIEYETLGADALLSIPTPDHYLPLLYVLGARKEGESVQFPVEGVDGGSISMLAARFG